jgi:hypothetical protein
MKPGALAAVWCVNVCVRAHARVCGVPGDSSGGGPSWCFKRSLLVVVVGLLNLLLLFLVYFIVDIFFPNACTSIFIWGSLSQGVKRSILGSSQNSI